MRATGHGSGDPELGAQWCSGNTPRGSRTWDQSQQNGTGLHFYGVLELK